ncbi:hypothetical protein [Mycoplasma sp. CSL7503-lung]|uniref:hypothetical protein n=1 Tax=Mycoplasma sp. CSL7503-lung TaxID=536372 RepID=UPI0021D0C7D0|nr:hypothetical protein [Mycoplasma sp. CSL7503-lung]MCU4707008.1 hypothetical protein [Mycoplasma sp. CSL7503-lung]
MKTENIEYINQLSCNEITKLSEDFKNSYERKELNWKINKVITRYLKGQNDNLYQFKIYEYYYLKIIKGIILDIIRQNMSICSRKNMILN